MYVECHRRIQALKALGENIDVYWRVLAPKVLRAFPADICRRWFIHAKREGIPESSITKLMEYLNEEVDGALNAQKIRCESSPGPAYVPTAAAIQVSTKLRKSERQTKQRPEAFCAFCEARGHWAQDCQQITDAKERIEKLKATNRCFLCLIGDILLDSVRGKARPCALYAKGHTRSLSAILTRQMIRRSFRQTSCLSATSTLLCPTSLICRPPGFR